MPSVPKRRPSDGGHRLSPVEQTHPGGLAMMTHWWHCSCAWECPRRVGLDGLRTGEDEAAAHAAEHDVPFRRASDDLTPEEVAALGVALGRVLIAAARHWEAQGITPEMLAARLREREASMGLPPPELPSRPRKRATKRRAEGER